MIHRLLNIAATIHLTYACVGCGNYNSVEHHGGKDAFHVVAYEASPEQRDAGAWGSMQIGGVTLRQERDLSVVLVFPSGRRERVRMNTAPPTAAVVEVAGFVDRWQPPPPLGFVEYVHLLPAALAEDMRRKEEPYATDATRIAFALLSADHVPVCGAFRTNAFHGSIRLTREEWMTLFTALAERTRPAGSSAGIIRDGRFLGVGIVEGLHGTGDGPDFSQLRITLSSYLPKPQINRCDLHRLALVQVCAQATSVGPTGPASPHVRVTVTASGPATDLSGGRLLRPITLTQNDPKCVIALRVSGPVRAMEGQASTWAIEPADVWLVQAQP
jgi:hypothetical protein